MHKLSLSLHAMNILDEGSSFHRIENFNLNWTEFDFFQKQKADKITRNFFLAVQSCLHVISGAQQEGRGSGGGLP